MKKSKTTRRRKFLHLHQKYIFCLFLTACKMSKTTKALKKINVNFIVFFQYYTWLFFSLCFSHFFVKSKLNCIKRFNLAFTGIKPRTIRATKALRNAKNMKNTRIRISWTVIIISETPMKIVWFATTNAAIWNIQKKSRRNVFFLFVIVRSVDDCRTIYMIFNDRTLQRLN